MPIGRALCGEGTPSPEALSPDARSAMIARALMAWVEATSTPSYAGRASCSLGISDSGQRCCVRLRPSMSTLSGPKIRGNSWPCFLFVRRRHV